MSGLGKSLKLSNYVFIGLFAFEASCKIIALGFLFAEHTYLRSGEMASGWMGPWAHYSSTYV